MNFLERACLEELVSAWNIFVDLPALHPDERAEFRAAIHAAQAIIMARPVQRQLNAEDKL